MSDEPKLVAQEPVARVTEFIGDIRIEAECLPHTGDLMKIGDLLYTASAPDPVALVPLTDEQIEEGRREWLHGPAGVHPSGFYAGVRFAEAQFGIKAGKEQQ